MFCCYATTHVRNICTYIAYFVKCICCARRFPATYALLYIYTCVYAVPILSKIRLSDISQMKEQPQFSQKKLRENTSDKPNNTRATISHSHGSAKNMKCECRLFRLRGYATARKPRGDVQISVSDRDFQPMVRN